MSEAHMHDNHRQRMRARIAKNGILSLEDHEILEYLLYPFVPRKDTNPIAHNLIAKFGSFDAVLEGEKREKMVALLVDNAGRVKQACELGRGGESDCHIRVNELVMLTQNFRCNYVYIAHNHPGITCQPSYSDVEFTKWAIAALEVLGVKFLDHIIIGRDGAYSFKKDGDLERFKSSYVDFIDNGQLTNEPRRGR